MDQFVFFVEPLPAQPSSGDSRTTVSPVKAVASAIEADGGSIDTIYSLDGTGTVLAIAQLDPDAASKVVIGLRRHYGLDAKMWRAVQPERFEQLWTASATPARSSR